MSDLRLGSIYDKLTVEEQARLTRILLRDPLKPVYTPGMCLYMLMLLVVLLWPFDMFYDPAMSRNWPFLDLPLGLISSQLMYIRDFISNIVIFIPLGFLLSGFLFGQKFQKISTGLIVVAIGFTLSFTVELLQFASSIRHSSFTDLATNTTGTWLGNLAHVGFLLLIQSGITNNTK